MIALTRHRPYLIGLAIAGLIAGSLGAVVAWTRPVRESVRTYTELLAAANRQDVSAARALCSRRYALSHPLSPAPDGGLTGLPRNIHKNFQAWRDGNDVLLCPTNRVGPVYRFLLEKDEWRFDGPVGILLGRGQFVPIKEGDEPLQPN
jgi:hypothetical protein